MSYNVKVNGSVLPELYTDESIRGYAPAWKAYNAEVEVALSGTHTYVSLAKFLGEPGPPKAPTAPPPPPSYAPPSFAPPSAGGFVPPPAPTPPPRSPVLPPTGMTPFGSTGFQPMGQPQGMRPPHNAQLKTGMATTGLILGILSFCGLFTCGLTSPLSIPGLIFSIIANQRAKRSPRVYGGQGMALGGIITNVGSMVIIFPLVAAIAVPNLFAARRSANQASAKQSLRNILEAQEQYRAGLGKGSYAASLKTLGEARLIDDSVAGMEQTPKSGYVVVRFETTPATATSEPGFSATVSPSETIGIKRTGDLSFFIDESGVIRSSRNGTATAKSPSDERFSATDPD